MSSKPLSKIKKVFLKLRRVFKRRKPPINQQSEAKPTFVPEPVSKAPPTSTFEKSSLWDRAYDSLKERDEKLVKAYEQLLSRELQTITHPKNDIPDNKDEIRVDAENRIENDDHKLRLTQLETIASKGLQQLDENKARFNIFGHEFVLRDRLAQATQFVQTIKDAIDVAVRASPEASLAWAGFCVILPIFMNPSAAEEASREGCLYVTSRVPFYVKLESLLSAGNRVQDSGLDVELEDRLITLYQLIIDFQIRTVRRVYLTRLKRLKEDAIQHENWKDLIARIQESEKAFSDDLKVVNGAAMGATLEELNSTAEKLLADIDSMLTSLIKNSGDVSTFYFQNVGSGHQFNTTEGIQYNATDKSMQFNGGTFSGTVTFN
ncbi:hypothetical protein TGAMA5MH_06835 [Trichoderma gamsii]|uniref:NWD NACHT-NTPase N-terminal domain-containing protein n=1 Tax=Trichoderma gamsii TaxID=398673 RepID=A0A2K0T615_9HYPO|nr:hypothetical protein TGAMA5MH_06835 [Trichoderma gamsii]